MSEKDDMGKWLFQTNFSVDMEGSGLGEGSDFGEGDDGDGPAKQDDY